MSDIGTLMSQHRTVLYIALIITLVIMASVVYYEYVSNKNRGVSLVYINSTMYPWDLPGGNITLEPDSPSYSVFGPSVDMFRMYLVGNITLYGKGDNLLVRTMILNTSCTDLSLNSFNYTQLERFAGYDSGNHEGSISFNLELPITSGSYCFILNNPTGTNETAVINIRLIVTVQEYQP